MQMQNEMNASNTFIGRTLFNNNFQESAASKLSELSGFVFSTVWSKVRLHVNMLSFLVLLNSDLSGVGPGMITEGKAPPKNFLDGRMSTTTKTHQVLQTNASKVKEDNSFITVL